MTVTEKNDTGYITEDHRCRTCIKVRRAQQKYLNVTTFNLLIYQRASVTSVEQVMFLAVTPVEFNNKTILEVSFPKIHITARFAGTH